MQEIRVLWAILQNVLTSLHNYFDSSTKLFSGLYPTKFLDTLAKPFFTKITSSQKEKYTRKKFCWSIQKFS